MTGTRTRCASGLRPRVGTTALGGSLGDGQCGGDLRRRTLHARAGSEFEQERIAGGDLGDDRIDARLLHELRDLATLRLEHEGDDGSVVPGASGATGTMQVGLVLDRRISVDDEGDVVDMDAAGGDVGGDEHHGTALGERGEVAGTHVLSEVAVHLDGRHTAGVELLGERLGPVLGAGEHDGAPGRRGEVDQDVQAIGRAHMQHVMGHGVDRRLLGIDAVRDRIIEVALDDHVDAVVERGREEHVLGIVRHSVEQTLHTGQEPEVGHVICLVEHRDLDPIELAVALVDEILEPPGTGDDDIDAVAQRVHLGRLADTTEDRGGAQADGLRQRGDGGIDLDRQLTGGGEDQCTGPTGTAIAAAPRESREHGEAEGEGLARARATATEHVATGE